MSVKRTTKAELIAPCGMDCALCMAWLRTKNRCPGCRGDDSLKSRSCVACIIKNCDILKETGAKYCSTRCGRFPCRRLRDLDKRYRSRYHMSMLENLDNIERLGIRAFVRSEKARWACPECGGLICVHRGSCSECGEAMGEPRVI